MLDEGREDSRTRDRWGPLLAPRGLDAHIWPRGVVFGAAGACRRPCVGCRGNRHVTVAVSRDPRWTAYKACDLGFCAPSGTRTPNPLIKSQLLCQLS